METEVAGNAVDNVGTPHSLNLVSGGRNDIPFSGQVGVLDMECKEKNVREGEGHESTESGEVGFVDMEYKETIFPEGECHKGTEPGQVGCLDMERKETISREEEGQEVTESGQVGLPGMESKEKTSPEEKLHEATKSVQVGFPGMEYKEMISPEEEPYEATESGEVGFPGMKCEETAISPEEERQEATESVQVGFPDMESNDITFPEEGRPEATEVGQIGFPDTESMENISPEEEGQQATEAGKVGCLDMECKETSSPGEEGHEATGSGQVGFPDMEFKEITSPDEEHQEASEVAAVGLKVTRNTIIKGGDKKQGEGGTVVQSTAETVKAILQAEQIPSEGINHFVPDMIVDHAPKDAEMEAECEHKVGALAQEKISDAFMIDVAKEPGTGVSSPVEEGYVGICETQSVQVDPHSDPSKRLDTKITIRVNTSLNCSSEFTNDRVSEGGLLESGVLTQREETTRNLGGTSNHPESLMVIQESRIEPDRHRMASSSIAEVLKAGVAAGVVEGIAESIAETIAKETAGLYGQGSVESQLLHSGRYERMAIAKAVAEVIAEDVAQEVAQGLADGLAEAAATAEASTEASNEQSRPDTVQGLIDENEDGVPCDCGLVAVVRVVGEKSPNRGLRYLMCSLQEPSFFKRKGKRKESDTIGKCKFFRWLDAPRHPSKEDKKNHGKVKAQLEDPNASHLTRSSAKKSNLESPTTTGMRRSLGAGEDSPFEFATPRNTDDNLQAPELSESTADLNPKPARKQRKRGLSEESGKEDVLVADRPTSAGTLTRSALRKGVREPSQEPSLDASAVSTPASALGKRTSDWTDSYVGPESQVFEKGATWRKRRSVRGESGPTSRFSTGGSGSGSGSGSGRNTGFVSSEKKPLHYFRRSTGQIGASNGETIPNLSSSNPVTDVQNVQPFQKDEKDYRFKSYYKKGKVGSSLEPKSAEPDVFPVEPDKKSKSQTRRQQRKLPLSEVYGSKDPLLPAKMAKKGTTILGKDDSLSPSGQSYGKSAAFDVASDLKEAGQSNSPPKKRKLSWVLSEDSVRETDSPKRASARKSIPSAQTNSESQFISSSVMETPLVASVFPTVRYEAKLPIEDYHDPDDPWSLEIPWAKQEHRGEEAQQGDTQMETGNGERNEEAGEGVNTAMEVNVVTKIETVKEAPAIEEELPKTLLSTPENFSVPEPGESIVFETAGDVPGPVPSDINPNEPGEKDMNQDVDPDVNSGLHMDQENIYAVGDTGNSLVDAVDGGENIQLACTNETGEAHLEPLADGQQMGFVLKEDPVETQHEVLRDEQTLGDKTQTSMIAAETGTPIEADGHEPLMSVTATIDESAQSAPDKNDSTLPLEQLPFNEGADILTNDSTQPVHVGEPIAEDVNREENLLIGSVPSVSKDSSSKLDDAVETDVVLPCERSEPLGILGDAEVTKEGQTVLSGDEREIGGFHEDVKRTDGSNEEPAVSGSNLIGEVCPDARLGQGIDHDPEKDLADTRPDQDAAFKSPRETDHAGAASASEDAGCVNSVWRLASGKKTRSIGSIGAPAVTSKRSRSGVSAQKGGPKGDLNNQEIIQWVDVPLDWRNEKSTGRVPLLPNISGKGLNGSDTSQSDLRLVQSGDTSQGTLSARPRLARGEIDDSSIITDEKEKGHDACKEDSMDFRAQLTNGAAGQAILRSTEMDDEASVPAGDHSLGDPTSQEAGFAGDDNAVQKRKRGRPRKDSKKPVGLQYPVSGVHKLGAGGEVNTTPEPELAGVVGKADGEPSSMLICSTAMEGNTLTELHGEDRVSQLERSASNTERENGKPEGVSSGQEESTRPLDGSDFPNISTEAEFVAPYCLCKIFPRQATLKTVTRIGDRNEGLRYWSCSNNRKLLTKKRKSPSEVTEESCNFFWWLDTPRFTAKDKREARKERYRQVELQRLL